MAHSLLVQSGLSSGALALKALAGRFVLVLASLDAVLELHQLVFVICARFARRPQLLVGARQLGHESGNALLIRHQLHALCADLPLIFAPLAVHLLNLQSVVVV